MSDSKVIPRPEWMDDEFLKTSVKTLNHIEKDVNLEIDEVALSYVVPKGENYLSILYRANVRYLLNGKARGESLIIKVSHDFSPLGPFLFDREIEMFRDVIPALREILQRSNLNPRFTCRYAHSTNGKPKTLVLDDLKPLGYVMLDRSKGLDLQHTKMIMKKLAQYHASTMCYFEKQSEEVKLKFSKGPFDEDSGEEATAYMKRMVVTKVDAIVGLLSKYEKYEKAANFFKQYGVSFEDFSQTTAPLEMDGKLNVLAHTDFWINNIMFKYDEDGSLKDLVFIDFQASHYTSVAYDFHYFFLSGTSNEVRQNHFEDVKEHYFESLVGYLKVFGYGGDMPTMDDFERDLKRSMRVVMQVLVIMLPIFLKSYDKEVQNREDSSEAFSLDQVFDVIGEENSGTLLTDSILASVDVLSKHGYFDSFPKLN